MYNEDDENARRSDGPRLPKGVYRGRGVSGGLGDSAAGNPQIGVNLEILNGELAGERITWYGTFGDELKGAQKQTSTQTTYETLRALGWEGTDLTDLTGIDQNDVEFMVDHEDYNGKSRTKVKWVRRAGVVFKNPMTPDKAKAFAAQMAQKFQAMDIRNGRKAPQKRNGSMELPPISDDDIAF